MKSSAASFIFGTVGSPLSTPKNPGGTVGGIQRLAELDLAALELAWVRAVRVSADSCARIKTTARQQAVALSIHAPYFINLNASRSEWPNARKRLMEAARCGYLAGATDIVFHPGSYFGAEAAAVLKTAIPRLRACVKELRERGNPVILRPETMGKSALLGTLEDSLCLAEEIEGVSPCLDIAHLHARANGGMNSYAEWAAMLTQIKKRLGARALRQLHIHLSGIAYTAKGEKKHLPLAEADLKYAEFFQVLQDFGCAGRILSESPKLEEDAVVLQKAYRQLAAE